MRTFISINPDQAERKSILNIQEKVKNEISNLNRQFSDYIKWEAHDKFHMTLFFIGDIDENKSEEVSNLLERISPGSIGKLDFISREINAFPKLKYPRVIILELDNKNKKVHELSERINFHLKNAGFTQDKKFHPHITLGRVRRDHKINLMDIKNKISTKINFSVSKFCLMKSVLKGCGSEYSVIREFEL